MRPNRPNRSCRRSTSSLQYCALSPTTYTRFLCMTRTLNRCLREGPCPSGPCPPDTPAALPAAIAAAFGAGMVNPDEPPILSSSPPIAPAPPFFFLRCSSAASTSGGGASNWMEDSS